MVQKNNLNKILIICGPTASGKSALAVECAKILNSEVISADSMNIYKGLDIGTAKPTAIERQGVLHHCIDIVNAKDDFSVSDYRTFAEPIIQNLIVKNKIPIICGGTGFYINSIIYDLSYGGSSANLQARNHYLDLAQKHGKEFVYNILKEKDIESAKKLHQNDIKRVVRALEIFESGKKKSDIKDDFIPKYDYRAFSINHSREILYNRINLRVDQMFNDGLVNEVKSLLENGVTKDKQCMQGIGYKEVIQYLNGEINLEQAIELIKLNTRHYAKRQITFFKKMEKLVYLPPNNVKDIAKKIVEEL